MKKYGNLNKPAGLVLISWVCEWVTPEEQVMLKINLLEIMDLKDKQTIEKTENHSLIENKSIYKS